jgi:hypothetical protein
MPRIKRIITLAAFTAATAAAAPAIAAAVPIGPDAGSGSTPNSDVVAAQHAATSMSAPLDRFGLAHVHRIARTGGSEVTKHSDPGGFQFDDAAVGAGALAGLVLLGTAGAVTVRRRVHLPHP